MDLVTRENIDELLKAQSQIWTHSLQFIKSMSLKCAVELGIPDAISNRHGQPMSLSDLVSALQVNPAKAHHLHRLMRLLVHCGLFSLKEDGYLLNPSSRLLLKDTPLDSRPFISLVLDPILTEPYNCMSKWLKKDDDQSPFVTAVGESLWEHAGHEIRVNNLFNEAMASDSFLIGKVVMVKCKEAFEGLDSLVDVAGGSGNVAKAIANTFPNLKCTVLDLPHVVAGLQGIKNLNFLAGDMFEAVPPADAVLLKWILHDWTDEDCVKILKNCKKAITKNGEQENKKKKVIIIDMVMGNQTRDNGWTEAQVLFDMEMMVCLVGKERNEKEWTKLFFDAGFTKYKIDYVLGPRAVIEVYP